MKPKYLFIILITLILATSVTAVAAGESASINGCKFEIPDVFEIYNQSSDVIVINNDDLDVISIYAPSQSFTADELKEELIKQGYTFKAEDTSEYENSGIELTTQNFEYENMFIITYIFTVDDQLVQITFIPHDKNNIPEYEDNPVTDIIYSIIY
jgi:hypothetical protein